MKTNYGFWSYLAECSLDWEIFSGRDVEKIKIHILCLLFFSFENRAVYETMWENILQPDRPGGNIIWRMRIACWITKDTDTHSEYIIVVFRGKNCPAKAH